MTNEIFDVVVIGGGPGGYVAAIRAAQLGMKVACVEKRGTLGGTCLNVGCIPSKALLHSSHLFEEASNGLAKHGIKHSGITLDLAQMMKTKDDSVAELTKGIEFLFKKNKVTYFKAAASLESATSIKLKNADGEQVINAKNIVIATGSEVVSLPGIEIDEKQIVSSTGALSLTSIPKTMIVVGGGVIGLEMGSVWSRLGTEVTVVEYLDKIVPTMDLEIGKQFQKTLEKQGFKFRLSMKVLKASKTADQVTLEFEPAAGGAKEELKADVVLVAVGRKPNTEGLTLDKAGVKLDNRGRIEVNHNFATNIPGIFAIGDVIVGPMLAHKAEEEGVAVMEILAGQARHVNYNTIPNVIYTNPEVASVGKTEEELKQAGVNYVSGVFPFLANSRAKAVGKAEGMVKILSDKQTDEVLGVHIIGPDAGTIIAEAVLAMEYRASSEDIARTCHAHPTYNEALKEAALAVLGRAIHK